MHPDALWFDWLVLTGPLSVAQRLNLRLYRIFLALVFLVVVLGCFGPMLDNVDLGWHVAQGRWMAHHLAFYRADALNYPTAGQPMVDEYPLFQVILYLSTLAGWWGPCVLCALTYLLLLLILVLTGWMVDLGPSATFSLIVGVMLLYLNLVFPLRPHVVTFLGIAAFGSFLLRHREPGTWTHFWPLALLQVIWTNCHSGFVLGPLMVAGFGVEMILRRWLRNRVVPWTAVRIWSAATALVFLGCFANPWGVLRLAAPFYQGHLEAIRAYVGEMQPLGGGGATLYNEITLFAVVLIAYVIFLRRGAISWSLLAFTVAFYFEALQVRKAWPIFGVFLPLVVLSSAAFARTTITRRNGIAWFSVAGHMTVLVGLVMALMTLLGRSDGSLVMKWREWNAGRTELPVAATAWMKQVHLTGRLLHRCEDGGWLQQSRLVPTWADTGFGKYDKAFIRETGLLGLNPELISSFVSRYNPDYIVCDDFAFRWPAYLVRSGARMIFYSPNSSIWAARASQADGHPTIGLPQAERIFTSDVARNGLPRNMVLYGRSLIALNSMGDPTYAIAQLRNLPPEMHQSGWYWEAARIMCFQYPFVPKELRALLRAEADKSGNVAIDFCAFDDEANGNSEAARKLLVEKGGLSDVEATLLLKIEAGQASPEALQLAQRPLYDLSNGEHWELLSKLERQAGNESAAQEAHRKRLYYAPTDSEFALPPATPAR